MPYRQWSKESLRTAIAAVQANQLSINKAADTFGVPRTTLKNKISGSSALDTTQGPDPILNKAEEEEITVWAKNMARIGYGRTKEQIIEIVQKFIQLVVLVDMDM